MSAMPLLHPRVPAGRFELSELLAYEPPTMWRPEPGERVQGHLVKQEQRTAFGRSAPTLFVLVPPRTENPHEDRYVVIRASGVVLRGALDAIRPQPGEEIALQYEGVKSTADGVREYAAYRMAVRRGGRWAVAR